MRFIKEFRD